MNYIAQHLGVTILIDIITTPRNPDTAWELETDFQGTNLTGKLWIDTNKIRATDAVMITRELWARTCGNHMPILMYQSLMTLGVGKIDAGDTPTQSKDAVDVEIMQ